MLSTLFSCSSAPRGDPSQQANGASATPTPSSTRNLLEGPRDKGGLAALPALGETPIELKAYWEPMTGRVLQPLLEAPGYGEVLSALTPAEPSKSYESKRFLVFLPSKAVQLGAPWPIPYDSVAVGETWAIPKQAVAAFLKQLHPSASANLEIDGEGAFAVLRARSKKYWEIHFRAHVQFEVAESVFMNPAQFDGRLLVNLPEAKIEFAEFSVPTERPLNVAIDAVREERLTGIGFLPKLELRGGDPSLLKSVQWLDKMEAQEVRKNLTNRLYAFQAIEWSPIKVALARTQLENKPLFAIVIAGPLDDQSC